METVQYQIFMFSITLYGGFLIGVLYEIYRIARGTKRKKGLITSIWDILFLIVSFFIVIHIIFSSNFGDLRAYVFIGFIVGFFLYEKIIGRIFRSILIRVFTFFDYSIKRIIKFITAPLRFLWKLVLKPVIIICNYAKQKVTKIKKVFNIPKKALKVCEEYYKLIVKRDKN